MDESTLLNELKSLESAWGSLDHWLNFWVALVVIGVAMEVVFIVIEYRHELYAFNRGIICPPDKPCIQLFLFGLLGAGLVAIGVAGEFWIHVRAGKVEADMRGTNGRLVALVNDRASRANERAAGLEKDAEVERLARVRLEAQVAPRKISDDKMPTLVKCLDKLKGERFFMVSQGGAETEITDFAKQLESALKAAGLNFSGLNPINMPGAISNPGLTVSAGKDRTADASLLTRCLIQAGVPRSEIKRESAEPSQFGLSVGYKRR